MKVEIIPPGGRASRDAEASGRFSEPSGGVSGARGRTLGPGERVGRALRIAAGFVSAIAIGLLVLAAGTFLLALTSIIVIVGVIAAYVFTWRMRKAMRQAAANGGVRSGESTNAFGSFRWVSCTQGKGARPESIDAPGGGPRVE